MQKDLVEERRWISKQDYLEGLALAQLMPGPLAAQLAMYLGWIRGRVLGASLVALCFVFPSSGAGLAIIPFLRGGVVDKYHWLTERQFVDAVAVAMITPRASSSAPTE